MKKTEIKVRAKEILYSTSLGDRIKPEDEEFIHEYLISNHYNYDEVVSKGREVMVVRCPVNPNSRCFSTPNGTFSYIKCLTGKDFSQRYKVQLAARFTIYDQISEASAALGKQYGDHLDHIIPFQILLERWDPNFENLETVRDGVMYKFQDDAIAKSWYEYHKQHAKYQVLDAFSNISKGCKYTEEVA